VDNKACKCQKFVHLIFLCLEQIFFNRYVLYHEIILLFVRQTLTSCLDVLRKELINIVDNNSLLSNIRFLAILYSRGVLSLSHTRKNLLDQNNLVLCLNSLEPTDEVLITLPRSDLPEAFEVEEPLIVVSQDI
jgi:hypothetical protein